MVLLISLGKAQRRVAESVKERRLLMELTQEGLAQRSGVPLATLRKFEQKGAISIESLLKLLMIVGGIEEIIDALKPSKTNFRSIDEVVSASNSVTRKRGRRK